MRADRVIPTQREIAELTQDVMLAFEDVIFNPLRDIAGIKLVKNSTSDILQDYRDGQISFKDGVLKGKFSKSSLQTLNELNQQYDRNRKGFIISDANLQYQLAQEESNFLIAKASAIRLLKEMSFISLGIDRTETNKVIDSITKKAVEYTKGQNALAVENPNVVDVQGLFNKGINDSFNTYSEQVVQKMTDDLVEVSNYKEMNDALSLRYQQTERKAHRMADDQSHFYGAEARRQVYRENGAKRFVWKTKGDNKVRDSHRVLNGEVFYYANPPIVDGVQSLPTEPFGCRCVDIPIFENKEQAQKADQQIKSLGL